MIFAFKKTFERSKINILKTRRGSNSKLLNVLTHSTKMPNGLHSSQLASLGARALRHTISVSDVTSGTKTRHVFQNKD